MLKVSQFTFIPAAVRYDQSLNDKAKLLYGEIAAATNAYGISEDDNGYFGAALRVDSRTITRLISQLVETGHITRVMEHGRRKLRVNLKTIKPPESVVEEAVEPLEDVSDFLQQLILLWEKGLNVKIEKSELYSPLVRSLLRVFSKDQLITAIKNRIDFVNQSPWHQAPENKQAATSIDFLLRSEENIHKWLNMKAKTTVETPITPFKY
jgi:hypothetical protein